MRIVRIAVLAALAAASAFAQVKESINVQVVEVPVTVVDSAGNPVRGLTAANFRLLDQGKERPISSFDTIDLGVKQNAVAPMNPAARRNFMLLFDLSYSSPKSLERAKDAAHKFVEKSVQPRDLVGVGTIDVEHGFRLLTAFTTDRELVADAIANPAAFKSADPLQLSNETKLASLMTDPGSDPNDRMHAPTEGDIAWNGYLRRQMAADDAAERMVQTQRANVPYTRARVEKQIDFLGALAKSLRAVPGRKQIIFLSEGFDPSIVTGRTAQQAGETVQENEQLIHGQGYLIDTDTRFGNSTSQNFVSRMAQFFRGSDVVLHAIDIQGLRVQNDTQEGARISSNEGLALLSDPTGGMFIKNANNISVDFDRMLKAQEFVYVLSFQAPSVKAGTFHDLKVNLVNVPGRAQVYARAGYYEGGAQTPQERTLSNAEIILNDIAQSDVRVAGLAAAFPAGNGLAQVPVILELDGTDVVNGLKTNAAGIEIYLYAFDAADGLVRDRLYQALKLDLAKVGDRLRTGGLKYYATLTLPPGKYAVKALVRVPETDRKGFVRTDVVVPKAGEVAVLPAIFVDEHPAAVLVRGLSHATAADPFQLGGERFIPAAAPRVRSGATPRFAVFVTNAQADEVTFDAPKVKFLGAAQGSNGATALVMQVDDLNQLAVDLTVRAKGTTETQKIALK
jgi:VWFA-related protein